METLWMVAVVGAVACASLSLALLAAWLVLNRLFSWLTSARFPARSKARCIPASIS